jgi:hypothetical protein
MSIDQVGAILGAIAIHHEGIAQFDVGVLEPPAR